MSFTLNGGSTQAGPARRVARRAADKKGKSLIKHALHRAFARPVLHPWFRLRRGLTLGVRAAVIGSEGVLLVRRDYTNPAADLRALAAAQEKLQEAIRKRAHRREDTNG